MFWNMAHFSRQNDRTRKESILSSLAKMAKK